MEVNIDKEVYFDKYCKTCEHEKLKETDHPCDACLTETVNTYSHKPVCWEDKK